MFVLYPKSFTLFLAFFETDIFIIYHFAFVTISAQTVFFYPIHKEYWTELIGK